MSRAELVRASGLTRPTVVAIVKSLLQDGIAIESGTTPSSANWLLRLWWAPWIARVVQQRGEDGGGRSIRLRGRVDARDGEWRSDRAANPPDAAPTLTF